jgi:hypothetical protein
MIPFVRLPTDRRPRRCRSARTRLISSPVRILVESIDQLVLLFFMAVVLLRRSLDRPAEIEMI